MNKDAAKRFVVATTASAFRDLKGALSLAEQAFEAADARDGHESAALIAAAATQWVVSDFSDLSLLSPWVARLEPGAALLDSSDADKVIVYAAGVLASRLFSDAGRLPEAERCLKSFQFALTLSAPLCHADLLVAGAEHIASWMTNHGQIAAFDALAAVIERQLGNPALNALVRARWLFWLGTNQMFADQRTAAERTWRRARDQDEARSWPWLNFHLLRVGLRPLLEDSRFEAARSDLDVLRGFLDPTRPLDFSDYHHLRGWLALPDNDSRLAMQHYGLAFEAAARASLPFTHMAIYHSGLVSSFVSEEREQEAVDFIVGQPTPTSAVGQAVRMATVTLIGACRARRLRQGNYLGLLAQGLALARQYGLTRFFRLAPRLAAQLSADALAAGIEPDFVCRAIAERKLAAPSYTCLEWPWPVQLRMLGGFDLKVNRKDADLSRRKSLDLLRAIVVAGPLPCDADAMADGLWPDAEGDTARTSLDTTVHRLRKMLGRNELVTSERRARRPRPHAGLGGCVGVGRTGAVDRRRGTGVTRG